MSDRPNRKNKSLLWNYFRRKPGSKKIASCMTCGKLLSYDSSTGNLNSHLKRIHREIFEQKFKHPFAEFDDDSNSSVKFSSEVLSNFEQEDDVARCTICQKATECSVEEMKTHLEEDHASVLINILKSKPATEVSSDAEKEDNETYTEIIYLKDLDKTRKNTAYREPPKRRKSVKPDQEKLVKHTIVNEEQSKSDPAIDSFLSYIGVLLKNVPKETFPKLQLDVISLILNAQMTAIASHPQVMPFQIRVANNEVINNGLVQVPHPGVSSAGELHVTIPSDTTP